MFRGRIARIADRRSMMPRELGRFCRVERGMSTR
jgi:hypothetical protein